MIASSISPLSSKVVPPAVAPCDWRRIGITANCHDCDELPKVPGAGEIFVTPNGTRYQLMHNGVRVVQDGYCGTWMTELIRQLRGHHEPQEERVFHALLDYLPARATMLELGSYWAYYSLWFCSRVPNGNAILIEPDPQNLDIGRQNFDLNGATATFHQLCVGRQSHAARPFRGDYGRIVPAVPQVSLDDFLASERIEYVDLLLADIQGAEWEMLQGATRTIEQGRLRFAVISTHHHLISGDPLTHQKCLAFVQERQAHILAAHSVSESYSGDGLLVVSFDPRDRVLPMVEISRNHASNNLFRELEYDLAEAWKAQRRSPVSGPKGPSWRTAKSFVDRLISRSAR